MEGIVAGALVEKIMRALGASRRYLKDRKEGKVSKEVAEKNLSAAYDQLDAEVKVDAPVEVPPVAKAEPEAPKPGEVPDVQPKAPDTATLIPDDHVNYKTANAKANAPLMTPEAQAAFVKNIQDNPNWVDDGLKTEGPSGFNLSKFDIPEEAKRALEEVGKFVRETVPKTRKTLDEIAEVGRDLISRGEIEDAINKGTVLAKDIDSAIHAGKLIAASLSKRQATIALKLGQVVKGSPEALALQKEFDLFDQRFVNIQASTLGLQAQGGRAVVQGRIRVAADLSTDELAAIGASNGSLRTVVSILKEPPLWARLINAHNSVWINSMLSGAVTHAQNITSNSLNSVIMAAERSVGGALGGNSAMAREGVNLALYMMSSVGDGMRMAAKATGLPQIYKAKGHRWATVKSTGDGILDPHNSKISDTSPGLNALSTDNFKSLQNSKTADIFVNGFGQLASINSRLLTSEDEFFKQINYRGAVQAMAYTSGTRQGLKGDELAKYIARRLDESMDEQGAANVHRTDGVYRIKDAEYEEALSHARKATFTSKGAEGGLLRLVEAATYAHPYLRSITPFIRIPVNIMKAVGIRTPVLNLLSRNYREALSGKKGERAAADARGQVATGSVLIVAGSTLAYQGLITGRGPADPGERKTLIDTGWKPYSYKIGKDYVSFERQDPYAMFFGITADFVDAVGHMDDPTRDNLAASMVSTVAYNVTSKTYLKGLSQFMDAVRSPEGSVTEAFFRNRIASYIPAGINSIATAVGANDPYEREVRSVMDAIYKRLPGFSETLSPRRNVFGEVITARQALGPDAISPFFSSTQTDDKVKLELARLDYAFSPPGKVLDGIDLTQVKNAKGQDFYDRWQQQLTTFRVGRSTLKESLGILIASPRYAKWRANEPDALANTDDPKTLQEVRAEITYYRERAKQETLKEFPEVAKQLRADKQAEAYTDKGRAVPDRIKAIVNQLTPE